MMRKIKCFGFYNSRIEYLNASLCYFILASFGWYWGKNWLASWLGNQIPYDSW